MDRVIKLVPAISSSSTRKKSNKAFIVSPQAKQAHDYFPTSDNKAPWIFDLIHCDLSRPYNTHSSCDAIYFLTLVDDFSHAIWVYFLRNKKEVQGAFMSFFAMITRQFETTVEIVCANNITEFN